MGTHKFRGRCGLALLALLTMLMASIAEAQRKHMPSRTQEIPDTESGRPAASAERPTFKGRLLIYGPPSLPVTPPPEHVAPAPAEVEAKSAAPAQAPAAVAAPTPAPAPRIAAPAPVVTPTKPVEAPIAVPLPAPAPQAPVAAPSPAPEPKPAPIAAPTPAPEPRSAPVVAAPQPAPSPVASPTPTSAPVVAAPPPAPVIATPEAKREPIVRPEALAPAPSAAAKPPATRQDVALAAPSSAATPDAPVAIDMKVIESIFTCLAPGLPQDWRRAWVEITDQGGGKEKVSKFRYTNLRSDDEGEPLVPCNAPELTRRVIGLNDKLPPERRGWNRALLVIESDGEYELSYEYPK